MLTISQIRHSTGLSQKEFSELMGIPKKTIQNWESEANERNAKDYIIRLIERVVRAEGLDTNIPLDELEETGK